MVHITMLFTLLLSVFSAKSIKVKIIPKKEFQINGIIISFFVLFLFAALRENYGNDYKSYESIFVNAQNNINLFNVEYLFYVINRFFGSFHLMLACLSLLYLFLVYFLIITYVPKKYYWISLFIFMINPYLFFMSLSAIRQTLALCIFIIALHVKEKNKNIRFFKYLVLMLIASLIHRTSLLLIPIYFIYNAEKNVKLDMFIYLSLPLVLVFSETIFNGLLNWVLSMFEGNQTYVSYIDSGNSNSIRSTILFLFFYIYVLMNLPNLNGKQYKISKLYLIGLLFALLSYKISMFGRFQMYFDIFGIVTLPSILSTLDLKSYRKKYLFMINKYIYPLLLLAIFFLRYYSFFTSELWSTFFEYHTFLF